MQTYRGHLFHVTGSPRVSDARAHLISEVDGALVVDDEGVIAYSGSFTGLPEQWSTVPVVDHRPGFLLPGFVDAHIHFPQTFAVNPYGGGQLLEWLEHCVFPSESMLDEPGFARKVAKAFCRKRISVGTTSAMVFGSAFPHAQDALFEETK